MNSQTDPDTAGSSKNGPARPSTRESLENSKNHLREAGETLLHDLHASQDHVRRAADDLRAAAESTAEQLREQAGAALSEARKHAGTLCDQGQEYVRQNPLPSVLGALAAGFLVGILIRR